MKTIPFEAHDFLDSPEKIRAYLQIMLEENGVAGLQKALGEVAKARGMSAIARESGLGRQNLYAALSEDAHPRLETIDKIIRALGCRLTIA